MTEEQKTTSTQSPGTTSATVPLWLFGVMLVLLCCGAVYFDVHGGWFDSQVYPPFRSVEEAKLFGPPATGGADLGRGLRVYTTFCSQCHQPNGQGMPGQYPPLAGSEWVNEHDPSRLIRIPWLGLTGKITVKGQVWNVPSGMLSLGGVLQNKDDFAALLSYIRQAWGNTAPEVTVEQIEAVLNEVGSRTEYATEDYLLSIPVKQP